MDYLTHNLSIKKVLKSIISFIGIFFILFFILKGTLVLIPIALVFIGGYKAVSYINMKIKNLNFRKTENVETFEVQQEGFTNTSVENIVDVEYEEINK